MDEITRSDRIMETKAEARKRERALERQAEDHEPEDTTPQESVDWNDPGAVVVWYGQQIVHLLGLMRREKAAARLRALNGAVDSWSRAFRLSADTFMIQEVKRELDELRRQIEAEKGLRRIQ